MSERRENLLADRGSLQLTWDLVLEKLGRLRRALVIETSAAIQFKLEKQIADEEAAISKLNGRLEKIDRELNEIDRDNPLPFPPSPPVIISEPGDEAEIPLESPFTVVPANSRFYIKPDIYEECQRVIKQSSGLLRIKAPREMGKTSLLERLVAYGQDLNYRVVRINLGQVEAEKLRDLDLFLKWFCYKICRQLHLQINIYDRWDGEGGSNEACTEFIDKYILALTDRPLLLCLDNVERIYNHSQICDDFLRLLRSWYEKQEKHWNSLRMILLYVWPVEIKDRNCSPFNVGEMVEMVEFTPIQVQNLVALHRIEWQGEQIQDLMNLVGGHPFLIRLALYEVASGRTLLQTLLKTADLDNGLYREHLQQHFYYLNQEPDLKKIMKQIVQSDLPLSGINPTLSRCLKDSGLIKYNAHNVEPANQLYRSYFRRCL